MAAIHRPRIPEHLERCRELVLDDGRSWDSVAVDAADDDSGDCVADVAGAIADDVDLTESTFRAVRFTGASLRRFTARDCRFERCELSGVVFDDSALTRVEFADCRLSGAVFAESRLRSVRFDDCRLDTVNLRMATATPVAFHGCQLPAADFYGADLSGAELIDCDLSGAAFAQCRLAGARLHGSDLSDVSGGEAFRAVEIDQSQLVPLALAVFGCLDVRITER